jgi:hypothetical protein
MIDFAQLIPDSSPRQEPITEERIGEMVGWQPRRMKLSTEWPDALHSPGDGGKNWSLVLPFRETLENSFTTMCQETNHYVHIAKNDRCCIFLNDSQWDEESVEIARQWVETVGGHVAIRDCLALSFAIDYRMEGGDPSSKRTHIGELCRRAKPYTADEEYDLEAAKELVGICEAFIGRMTCYSSADSVVAMPPSNSEKEFDLPSFLAGKLAKRLKLEDHTRNVKTVRARKQLKETSVERKLQRLRDTIKVDKDVFCGKNVLVVDDLYQSGISLNYLGKLLLDAGADKVFGLACEKTVGNFDNLRNRDRR